MDGFVVYLSTESTLLKQPEPATPLHLMPKILSCKACTMMLRKCHLLDKDRLVIVIICSELLLLERWKENKTNQMCP